MTEPVGEIDVDPANDADSTPTEPEQPRFKPITTQRELEQRLGYRLREQRERFETSPDYLQLKEKADRLAEIEKENQTALERAQTEATNEREAREKLLAEIRATRIESAILAEAAKPNRRITDPEAAIDFLTGRDKAFLELNDDGVPTNVAQALDSLLEARPYLVAADGGTRGNADQGARTSGSNQLTEADLKSMKPEEINQARKEGRFNDLLGVR